MSLSKAQKFMSKSQKIKLFFIILITFVFLISFFLLKNNIFLDKPGDLNATIFLLMGIPYAGVVIGLIFWPVEKDPIGSIYYDVNYKKKIPEKLKATNFLIWILVGLTVFNWAEYYNRGGNSWQVPLLMPAIVILLVLIVAWLPFEFKEPLSQPTPEAYKIHLRREIRNPLWGALFRISLLTFFGLIVLSLIFNIFLPLNTLLQIINFGLVISVVSAVIFMIIDKTVNKTVSDVKEDKLSQYFSYMVYGVIVVFILFIFYIYLSGGFKNIGKVFEL